MAAASYPPDKLRGMFAQIATSGRGGFWIMGTHYYEWMDYAGNNCWEKPKKLKQEFTGVASAPSKRAGLAYKKHNQSTGLKGGRWYLLYNPNPTYQDPADGKGKAIRINMTTGDGNKEKWENDTLYDNLSFTSMCGAAAYGWRPGAGGEVSEENLRIATVYQANTSHQYLDFRPFGDGIAKVMLKDVNDWLIMKEGICSSLHGCNDPLCVVPGGTHACPGSRY